MRRIKINYNGNQYLRNINENQRGNLQSFAIALREKLNMEEAIDKIEITLKEDSEKGYYVIDSDETLIDTFHDDNYGELAMVHINRIKKEELSSSEKALNSTMDKLSLNSIPYSFNGSGDENVHHFKRNILNYIQNNGITKKVLLRLMLNGNIIHDPAFKYVQSILSTVNVNEMTVEVQLELIWKVLTSKYARTNQVFYYKSILQGIRQKNYSLKDYVEQFKEIECKLKTEIAVQLEAGAVYQHFSKHEQAQILIKGLNKSIKGRITDAIFTKYETPHIEIQQLYEVLAEHIKREQYLKSTETETASGGKPKSMEMQINEIQQQIQQNDYVQRDRGRGRNYGYYNNCNDNHYNNNKYKSKKCRNGKTCKFGLDCSFYHEPEEMDYFRSLEANDTFNRNINNINHINMGHQQQPQPATDHQINNISKDTANTMI